MSHYIRNASFTMVVLSVFVCGLTFAAAPDGEGWTSLFNNKDFSGWKLTEKQKPIWTVQDGVLDCSPRSDIRGDQSLWTEEEFGDFELVMEWRIKETKGLAAIPVIFPDGTHAKDASGKDIQINRPNADSGVYVRGSSKSQINIWCWPIGSGEVYGYRNDGKMPAAVRAGVTPRANADKPVGEWNSFSITMNGDKLTVVLNGVTVLDAAELPGVPERGPIALQHHGGYDPKSDTWNGASSLVQFKNIYIRELN
ncbi:MAG: hypothetical protein COA73_05050 [Candidatus Hydrogenedentota bacterium]|nr:MAG: hypothetical protein COA73_05050 [Candidatus Hydrogenedentota bacterium]